MSEKHTKNLINIFWGLRDKNFQKGCKIKERAQKCLRNDIHFELYFALKCTFTRIFEKKKTKKLMPRIEHI